MKKFKFNLQAVLNHRAVLENLRRQALAVVQHELAACDGRLAEYRAVFSATILGRNTQLDLEDLNRRERYLDTLAVRIVSEERVREGIAARFDDARSALLCARQAREAIERVREKAHTSYVEEALRAEQNMLDELSAARHGRGAGVTK